MAPTLVESILQAFLPVGPMAAALVEEQVAASVVGVAAAVQVVTSNWISELNYMWVLLHPQPIIRAESRDQFGNALIFSICDDIVRCTCAKVIKL